MRHNQNEPVLFKSKAIAWGLGNEDQIVTEGRLVGCFLLIHCPGLFVQVVSRKEQRYPP